MSQTEGQSKGLEAKWTSFFPLITRAFASFFPMTHNSPPHLKIISKNKKCILVWSHLVTNQRTSHPWKQGQRLGGREVAIFCSPIGGATAAVTDISKASSSHCIEKEMTPKRAGERFYNISMTGGKNLSYIWLLPVRILFQYIIWIFISSASLPPFFT